MHYITTIAKPIKLGASDFGTRELVGWAINSDKRFNATGQGIRVSVRIDAALKKSNDNKSHFIALQEDDWKLLCEMLEEPSEGFPFRPARNLMPFIEEVKAATEVEPPAPVVESIDLGAAAPAGEPEAKTAAN